MTESKKKNPFMCPTCGNDITPQVESYMGSRGGKALAKKKGKEYFAQLIRKRWDKEHGILQHNARTKLGDAIRKGKVKRQPCENCGDPKSEGHHTNYHEALNVVWLCKKCHTAEHKRLRDLKKK